MSICIFGVRRPFNNYVSKEVGGWGQKMTIFAILQYYLCWRRWVGLVKPKTCWRNSWNIRRLVNKSLVPENQQTCVLNCRLSDFSSSHANSTSKRHAAIQFKCHEKEQNWPKYAFPFKPYIIKLICLSLKSAVGNQESMYIFIFSCNFVLFWR